MTKTVMLVEDEVFVALDLQFTIEDGGWRVQGPYDSVEEALGALAHGLPDCAVLDVRLTDGEVYAAADRLYSAGVPFIFHSGHADERDLGARYPGVSVCSKPCSPTRLQSELRRVLDGQDDRRCMSAPTNAPPDGAAHAQGG